MFLSLFNDVLSNVYREGIANLFIYLLSVFMKTLSVTHIRIL
jgi:hypothetical protein